MQAGNPQAPDINANVGENVRARRKSLGLPRRALAAETAISERYIGQLETGRANITLNMLQKIAAALNVGMGELMGISGNLNPELQELAARFSPAEAEEAVDVLRRHFRGTRKKDCGIALIGLRGAGKTTLGKRLADDLGLEFLQLTRLVGEHSGMTTQELVELAGIDAFRRFEREALKTIIASGRQVVLETGGGIVASKEAYQLVLSNFRTVWIKARPEQHMQRVVDQNDLRPMAGNPHAMDHLKTLLDGREHDYGRAEIVLDTSGSAPAESLEQLKSAVTPLAAA